MRVREQGPSFLPEYARIPSRFEVHSVLDATSRNGGLGGLELALRPQSPAFVKDYDAIAGNRPSNWAERFDLAHWGLFSAELSGELLGGAAVARDAAAVARRARPRDVAVLFDLRVAPDARRRAVGKALFAAAAEWARARGARWLEIETQNVNVPACRFYAAQGCQLGAIDRFAYPELPDEVQLVWYKELS